MSDPMLSLVERKVNDLVEAVDNHILNNHAKDYPEYMKLVGKRQALVTVLVELADIKEKYVDA